MGRQGLFAGMVVTALREATGGMTHPELCVALDIRPRQLTNTLTHLVKTKRVQGHGTRGAFLYTLAGAGAGDAHRLVRRPTREPAAAPVLPAIAPAWPAPDPSIPFHGRPLVGAPSLEASTC